jgi:antitoxin (DNA-binding transcriptional repressor) of toxin-antitoxin stability system
MSVIKKENGIIKLDTNSLRVNLTKILEEHMGEIICITKHSILVADLKIYTEEEKKEAEITIAKMLIENSNKNNEKINDEEW